MFRHAALVFFGFIAFDTLFFAPVLFGGRLLMSGGDAYLYHYPAVFGSRALWDPLLFGGYPRFADPQMMTWYPLALPLSLTGWEWLWNPFLLAPYVLGSCFAYGLLWRLTRSALGSAVAGLVFGLSGFLMAHMQHVAVIHGTAWLPLLLWSVEELRHRFHRGWLAVLAAAVACCFLAGHVQIFVYSLLLCGLYVAFHLPWAPLGWWRYGLTAASGLALGLGLSAIQILPTFELVPHSQRAKMTFEEFAAFSFPKRQLPQLVFPYIYGGADLSPGTWLDGEPSPRRGPPLPYFGAWNFHELAGFCGLLSCVLAGAGFLGGLRTRAAWFWGLAAVAALVLALGDSTPLARGLYRMPVLNRFRCPCRFLLWFELAVAVLAGLGVYALRNLSRVRATLALLVASAVVLASVGVAWWKVARQMADADLFRDAPPSLPASVRSAVAWDNPALGLPLVGLLCGLVALWLWRWRPNRATAAALLAAVALDLGLFAWFAGWRPASAPAGILAHAPEPIADLLRPLRKGERVFAGAPLLPSTRHSWDYENPLHLEAAPVNVSSLWGVPNALGYTPLALERYWALVLGSWPFHGAKVDELLALRYLLSPVRTRNGHGVEWEEICLDTPVLGASGEKEVAFEVPSMPATRIGLISDLGCAVELPDGLAVAEVTVLTSSGPLPPISLRVGEHLAEHCWERADVRPIVRHRLPELTEANSTQDEAGRPFQVHHPVNFLPLGQRSIVTGVRFRWVGPVGPGFSPLQVTLIDDATGQSQPIHHLLRAGGPWQFRGMLADGSHLILENCRPLHRAWLTSSVVRLPGREAIEAAVREGKLPGGLSFEPYRTALVEEAVPFTGGELGGAAEACIERHEAGRVVVKTRADGEAFLVLGEVHYPGWRARIDGRSAHIYRTDSILRGVVVPPGEHRVEFIFRPVSFVRGLAVSGLSALVLVGFLLWRRCAGPHLPCRDPGGVIAFAEAKTLFSGGCHESTGTRGAEFDPDGCGRRPGGQG